jgi:hypothetical protein
MLRLVLFFAIAGAVFVLLKQRSDEASSNALSAPAANTAQVPKQFRDLIVDVPDPASILRERGAIPGLGAIRRLAGGSSPEKPAARPFADVGSRSDVREVRADIRRDIAALNRLTANGEASPAQAERTLAVVYSAPVLTALGADGRREFAEQLAGRTRAAQQIKVRDFEGIFVSGKRALAQVVYQLSIRAPSGRFIARSPQNWTVTLAREGGRWRFVRGFES